MTKNSNAAPQDLVTLILKDIRLENVSSKNISAIKDMKARERKIHGKTVWLIPFTDEQEIAARFDKLNNLGFLFVGVDPLGWPPADVFIHLRDKMFLKGNFKSITWRGPGDWVIRER